MGFISFSLDNGHVTLRPTHPRLEKGWLFFYWWTIGHGQPSLILITCLVYQGGWSLSPWTALEQNWRDYGPTLPLHMEHLGPCKSSRWGWWWHFTSDSSSFSSWSSSSSQTPSWCWWKPASQSERHVLLLLLLLPIFSIPTSMHNVLFVQFSFPSTEGGGTYQTILHLL